MIVYIIAIIISVIFHELAHLVTAVLLKVRVYAFSIGFGKILLSKIWKTIDWRISLIWLGGYCNLEERPNVPNSIYDLSYWKQALIILAGVVVNFVIACICYLLHFKSISYGLWYDWSIIKYIFMCRYDLLFDFFYMYPIKNIFLLELSLLNLTLFISNLLPIPPLDGGYLWLFPLRKKLSEWWYEFIIKVGLTIVIGLQIYLVWYLYHDLLLLLYNYVVGFFGSFLPNA